MIITIHHFMITIFSSIYLRDIISYDHQQQKEGGDSLVKAQLDFAACQSWCARNNLVVGRDNEDDFFGLDS